MTEMDAFVFKKEPLVDGLSDALVLASPGEEIWLPAESDRSGNVGARPRAAAVNYFSMTRREREVLSLLMGRYRNGELDVVPTLPATRGTHDHCDRPAC